MSDVHDAQRIDASDDALNLSDAWWNERERLKHIRQAARARRCAPDFVLGAVLARVAMLTPPTVMLPDYLIGTSGTVDWFAALVGDPSATKSSSMRVARRLLPTDRFDVRDGVPIGSGEGMVEAFLSIEADKDANGKPIKVKRQTSTAVLFQIDEGDVLIELGNRKGSTLFGTMRSAYMGEQLGNANASPDTRRLLQPGTYRVAVVMAFQPTNAAKMLNNDVSGTPQRMHWFYQHDIAVPDAKPLWPGALAWQPLPTMDLMLGIDDAIAHEYDVAARHALDPANDRPLLAAHEHYARLKFAALLCLLDERRSITYDDWRLAGVAIDVSRNVRTHIASLARDEAERVRDASDRRIINRHLAVEAGRERMVAQRMARSIARKAHRDGWISRSDATRATASQDRERVDIDEVIALAIELHWLVQDGNTFKPGPVPPE